MKDSITDLTLDFRQRLDAVGQWLGPLGLRVILAWEFWEAGIGKFRGKNWFDSIPWADWQVGFPWPFKLLSADLNWFFATWAELIFSLMLLFGLFTRFAAFSLLVVTIVATVAVHWPAEWSSLSQLWEGYAITAKGGAGNYKLPLLFALMLLPLILSGPGKLSLDALIVRAMGARNGEQAGAGALGWGIVLIGLGLPLAMLFPVLGLLLAASGIALAVASRLLRA